MKLLDNSSELPKIQSIVSYFLTSYITSFKFYGDDDGVLYSIENEISKNIQSRLEGRSNREGLYKINDVMSAIAEEIQLLSVYRYFDIEDSSIDDDYYGALALYVLDYQNKEYTDNYYTECSARCDIFKLSELKRDIYNKPTAIVFNKNKPYDYLFGNINYLVEKMLYSGAKTIEFHPISTIEDGGFSTEIKVLDEHKNVLECIETNGSSPSTFFDIIEYKIKNKDGVKIIETEEGKVYSFPQPSFEEDGLHLFLTEENLSRYQKWIDQLELSYSEEVKTPIRDAFCIHIEKTINKDTP